MNTGVCSDTWYTNKRVCTNYCVLLLLIIVNVSQRTAFGFFRVDGGCLEMIAMSFLLKLRDDELVERSLIDH